MAPRARQRWLCAAAAAAMAAVAGCGGGGAVTVPPAVASSPRPALPSTICSSSASTGTPSSAGASATGARSCVFVLSDERRFRCPLSFQRGPNSASLIERSRACVQLARLVLPAALRAAAARIVTARACLTKHGLAVTGGLVLPAPGGPDTTVGELDTADALIAFYREGAQAARLEPQVAKNMTVLGGVVARDGAENVAWLAPPAESLRHIVAACTPG